MSQNIRNFHLTVQCVENFPFQRDYHNEINRNPSYNLNTLSFNTLFYIVNNFVY